MSELIEPGRTGVIVEDMIEGYYKIAECFAMDRKYIAKRARSLFNYRNMAEQYVEAYQATIDRHKQLTMRERVLQGLKPSKKIQLAELWDSLITSNHKSDKQPTKNW